MAESVLTENELRGGCVLIDLGAETTTVMVYFKNILRHLVVIPIGQNNITKDIASLQMEENDAENVKLKYASAYTDINDIDDDQKVPVTPEMSIDNKALIDVVEARVQEIVENAWYQVPGEYKNKLLGGIGHVRSHIAPEPCGLQCLPGRYHKELRHQLPAGRQPVCGYRGR